MSAAPRRLRSPEPSRTLRILWAGVFGFAVALGVLGLVLTVVADDPRRGSPFLASCLGTLAMWLSLKTWWLMQGLTEALAAMTVGLARATGADAVENGSGFAAERSAPRSEGHGPGGGDPEGRSGDLGGSR